MNVLSYWKRMSYADKLVQITSKASPQPAHLTGALSCQRSGVCCWTRPCDLFPGDIERLAVYLNLTVQEVFQQHLIVDEIQGRLRLLPRREQQEGGKYLTSAQTYDIDTPCVFLDQEAGGCRVHDAKPQGGAQWSCTMPKLEQEALPQPVWTRDALIALGWDGDVDS